MPHRFDLASAKTRSTILVVDDDLDLLDLMREELSQHFTEVITAQDGPSALTILKKSNIDCILTDYRMPDMNGLELIKILAEKYPKIPVLLITGNGQNPEVLKAVDEGCFDFIEKPFHFGALVNRIRNSLLLPLLEELVQAMAASEFPEKEPVHFVNMTPKDRYNLLRGYQGLILTRLLNKGRSKVAS